MLSRGLRAFRRVWRAAVRPPAAGQSRWFPGGCGAQRSVHPHMALKAGRPSNLVSCLHWRYPPPCLAEVPGSQSRSGDALPMPNARTRSLRAAAPVLLRLPTCLWWACPHACGGPAHMPVVGSRGSGRSRVSRRCCHREEGTGRRLSGRPAREAIPNYSDGDCFATARSDRVCVIRSRRPAGRASPAGDASGTNPHAARTHEPGTRSNPRPSAARQSAAPPASRLSRTHRVL